MADQVDSMSDAELRTKLAEHGYPVMPITSSTRKLLVKKLKLVLDNKTKPRNNTDNKAESRRTLARYSSGEDSDLDTTSDVKEKRGRRATTGGAMLPPASSKARRGTPKKELPVKRDSDKSSSEDEKSPVRTHEEVETVTTRRITRTYKDGEDYETGSDSDVDNDRKNAVPLRSNSRSSDYISSTLPSTEPAIAPPKTTLFSRPSISNSGFTSTLSSADHLNSIRSRLGLSTGLTDRPSGSNYSSTFSTSTYKPSTSTIDEVESPYMSNFTRRLTSLSSDLPRASTYLDRDNNGSTLLPRRSYISGVSRAEAGDYKSSSDKKFLKNNLVSLALVGIVATFFFCLFFMYIVKKNDITSVVDDQNSVIPICQLNIPGNRPGINCVPKEQVTYAKDLLKILHPELTVRTAAYKCGKAGAMPYMTEREILDMASARTDSVDLSQCRSDLNNLEVLLVHNPRWGLGVVQLKNLYTKEPEYTQLTSTDVVVRERNKGSVAIAIADPTTPMTCLIVNSLYSAGSSLALVGLLSLMVIGAQKSWKYYQSYQKKKSDEVYSMVEQIIDVISQETEDSGEPYLSIDHVRDTLISPQNRDKMSSIWDAAVKFIQKNESRVRMEVQSVDGEDCRVWRWISPHGSPKRSAAWQGQAFETQEGSVNNLPVSPTQCLKIRSMFDKNDTNPNLRSVIQDAILEKCGDRCNILHIDVERASCCVYVKCATTADAGLVYRSLHGWWYEGHLITVKYLRLERYLQRFPNSPGTGPYLKLSRNQKRNAWDE